MGGVYLRALEEVFHAKGYGYYLSDVIGGDLGKSHVIHQLISSGYIEERFTPDGRSIIRLSDKGRRTIA